MKDTPRKESTPPPPISNDYPFSTTCNKNIRELDGTDISGSSNEHSVPPPRERTRSSGENNATSITNNSAVSADKIILTSLEDVKNL